MRSARSSHSCLRILSVLVLGACAGAAPIESPEIELQRHLTYTVDDRPLRNPERGFVQAVDVFDEKDVEFVRGLDVSLASARVRLDPFMDGPISATFIEELERGFDRIRRAGLKVVLRFQYNNGSGEDPPIEIVLSHIEQLAPILQRHADVTAVVQAGFVGAWGEWHTSWSGLTTTENRRRVLRALLDAVPEERAIQVRSPIYKEEAFPGGPVTPHTAFSTHERARIGHHNDCFLSGETDRGTYPEPVDEWREYFARDSRFVPVGGESCELDHDWTHCGRALRDLRRFHWSFINRSYHPDVLAAWKREGCYQRIARDVGYRLALRRATLPAPARPGEIVELYFEIDNLGFAPPINRRPVFVAIGTQGSRTLAPLSEIDVRRWGPDRTHKVSVKFEMPSLPAGVHDLALWLPDEAPMLRPWSAYSIRLANEGTWRPELGDNVLGKIRVL